MLNVDLCGNCLLLFYFQIYKLILMMVMLILYCIIGVVFYFGMILFVWWLIVVVVGLVYFDFVNEIYGFFIGWLILFGFIWVLVYYMFGGFWYFIWDMGVGFGKEVWEWFVCVMIIGLVFFMLIFWIIGYVV